jgi:hypothetical protein
MRTVFGAGNSMSGTAEYFSRLFFEDRAEADYQDDVSFDQVTIRGRLADVKDLVEVIKTVLIL